METCGLRDRGKSKSMLIVSVLTFRLRISCSSSSWGFTGPFPSLCVKLRVRPFIEKRDSRAGVFINRGEGISADSGLYMGDVYDEEFGLRAAGVGGAGSSAFDWLGESSGRLKIPACAAGKFPYTARLGAI
jgi:hypothetical protein